MATLRIDIVKGVYVDRFLAARRFMVVNLTRYRHEKYYLKVNTNKHSVTKFKIFEFFKGSDQIFKISLVSVQDGI